MLEKISSPVLSSDLIESRDNCQHEIYYDCLDYSDFPPSDDAADEALSASVLHASQVSLSEDGRRCLVHFFSALAEHHQSQLLHILSSNSLLGLPIEIASLAHLFYTMAMEGRNTSALITGTLTFALKYGLEDCNSVILVAQYLKESLREGLGADLADALCLFDKPQDAVCPSLLALSCCAAALYVCRGFSGAKPAPQRFYLRLPTALVTLFCQAQIYCGVLNAITRRAAKCFPSKRAITHCVKKTLSGGALNRFQTASLSWMDALKNRLITNHPQWSGQRVGASHALGMRNSGAPTVNYYSSAGILPAMLPLSLSTFSWPKKILWSAIAMNCWTLAHQGRQYLIRPKSKLVTRSKSLALTHSTADRLLREFSNAYVSAPFYHFYFNSLLNRASQRPSISQCPECHYGVFIQEVYRQTVDEINFIQTLRYTTNVPLPNFLQTMYKIHHDMQHVWTSLINASHYIPETKLPINESYLSNTARFSVLESKSRNVLQRYNLSSVKEQLLALVFYKGQEESNDVIIPLEFCRQIFPELSIALAKESSIARGIVDYLTNALHQELFEFQHAHHKSNKNIVDFNYANQKEIYLSFNENDPHNVMATPLMAMLVYKRILPSLEYLKTNGTSGEPSLPLWALEHLIDALIQGAGTLPIRITFPQIVVGQPASYKTDCMFAKTQNVVAKNSSSALSTPIAPATLPSSAAKTPNRPDLILSGLALAGLAAVATIYGYKAAFGLKTPPIVIIGGAAAGTTTGAMTALCSNDIGVVGLAAFNTGLLSGPMLGDLLKGRIKHRRQKRRPTYPDFEENTFPGRHEATRDKLFPLGQECPALANPPQVIVPGRHPFHYVQELLEPTSDKVLFFGNQYGVTDPKYAFLNESINVAHNYLRQTADMFTKLMSKFNEDNLEFKQQVRRYLQTLFANNNKEILDQAEEQLMGYCRRAEQFLSWSDSVDYTNIVIASTLPTDANPLCLNKQAHSNIWQLPIVYGAQLNEFKGMVFIVDALACHPHRQQTEALPQPIGRIYEDVLRTTLQTSSVLSDYISLTPDSLSLLPDNKQYPKAMMHSLSNMDHNCSLYELISDYTILHNLTLPLDINTFLTQHPGLKANIIMNNIDHVAMILKEIFIKAFTNPSAMAGR